MKEVTSSNISHIGYDAAAKILKVRFKKGGEYHYFDVPEDVHDSLLTSQSIGSHFAKNIKNVYQFTKAEQ